MTENYDVILIGGGASGLMCAACLYAENPSLKVLMLEKKPRVGKKLLTTGNGRCNLINLKAGACDYFSDDIEKLESVFARVPVSKVLNFFKEDLGLETTEVGDLVYPATFRASSVLDCLRLFPKNLKVITQKVESVTKDGKSYTVNNSYVSPKIVFACGGASAPSTGSDGKIYSLLKKLSVDCVTDKIIPVLTPLKSPDKDIRILSGQRIRCNASLGSKAEEGELQFTDYGVSGIMAMQLSREFANISGTGKDTSLHVDLMPSYNLEEKAKRISELNDKFQDRTPEDRLVGILSKPLASVVIKRAGGDMGRVPEIINDFKININGTLGFDHSQVTRGGIKLSELSENLELESNKGIYICGELVNVDGPCGGFNLYWAWASAMICAKGCLADGV